MDKQNSRIISLDIEQIKNYLKDGKIRVCVIGIGRIGFPSALSFANSGLNTTGVDINLDLINQINSGEYPLKDEPDYDIIFEKVIKNKKFQAASKIEDVVPNSDVILLSLPTPIDENNVPDYSALKSVGNQLHDLISEGTLIIVESTIEPGFVENELIQIIEGKDKRLIAGKNFGIGVCPETAKDNAEGNPTIFGDGSQIRDFVYVEDVAKANLRAMESRVSEGFFNLGSGIATSILDLANMFIKASHLDLKPTFEKPLKGEIKMSQADLALIKKTLNWKPETNLEDWIKKII